MINKKFKNILAWFFLLSILSMSWFYTFKSLNDNIYYADANYIADFWDYKKVSWFADNIFIWEVIENIWSDQWDSWLPVKNTKFEVNVIYNIKWNIKWNINIIQEAWYDELWNLFITEWNKYLEEWDIYLLSTKWDNYTILSHYNWSHFLTSNSLTNKKDIKNFIKNSSIVKEYRKSYKEEVYYQENDEWWKYKISSEKNAYKSLTKEEKNKLENIENGFVN